MMHCNRSIFFVYNLRYKGKKSQRISHILIILRFSWNTNAQSQCYIRDKCISDKSQKSECQLSIYVWLEIEKFCNSLLGKQRLEL